MKTAVIALLCLAAAASLVYFPITKYDVEDPATGGKTADVAQYIRMFQGAALTEIPTPYRYRVLTPWLARQVPWLPDSVSQHYDISPVKIVKFKFGMVNMAGLAAAGFFLYLLGRALRLTSSESLLGSYLFFTAFFVVNYGGVPLVDSLSWAFLTLGIYAAVTDRYLLLFLAFTIGMFAKETNILIPVAVLLLSDSRRVKLAKALLCLPGIAGYGIFRLCILPTDAWVNYGLASALQKVLQAVIPSKIWIYWIIDGGLTFGVLWGLALHGFLLIRQRRSDPLYRLSFLVPLVMVIPFLIGSNVGRIWFLSFPIMIPLSLVSLRRVLGGDPKIDAALGN
jgi:hypothetical protein